MALIPSLTQPVLGADGRLALKQDAHAPVFLSLSVPEIPLTSICSLLLMDRCWSVLENVCVLRVHILMMCVRGCGYVCTCFSDPVISSRVLTQFSCLLNED